MVSAHAMDANKGRGALGAKPPKMTVAPPPKSQTLFAPMVGAFTAYYNIMNIPMHLCIKSIINIISMAKRLINRIYT